MRLAPIGADGVLQPDEQPLQVVLAGLLDLAALDAHVVDDELALVDQLVEVVAERGQIAGELLAVSSKVIRTPGSPNCTIPLSRKLAASRVLPEPAPPQTNVGRPAGRPPLVISSRPCMPVGDFAISWLRDTIIDMG